jgi:hypothetical protein
VFTRRGPFEGDTEVGTAVEGVLRLGYEPFPATVEPFDFETRSSSTKV